MRIILLFQKMIMLKDLFMIYVLCYLFIYTLYYTIYTHIYEQLDNCIYGNWIIYITVQCKFLFLQYFMQNIFIKF